MSFKRVEGDAANMEHNLKERRVSELLGNNIPKDEALRMKNGKFACLVCSNNPIFDTIAILVIHRNGKKHLAKKELFDANKEELCLLKEKRRHSEYLKCGKVEPESKREKLSFTQSLGAEYNPSHKVKKQDDKPSAKSSTTGLQTISSYRQHCAKQDHLTSLKLKPYVSKKERNTINESVNMGLSMGLLDKQKEPPFQEETHSNSRLQLTAIPTTCVISQSSSTCTVSPQQRIKPGCSSCATSQSSATTTTRTTSASSSSPKCNNHLKTQPRYSEDKLAAARMYLKAVESGWKKDRGGNWIKDESVEFDSDEEPPNI